MKISYNWLKDLVPEIPSPATVSDILTSVGLEVEGIEAFEEVKGSLAGLVTGEILRCENHSAADKLKVTDVDMGNGNIVQIICGATNVAVGQKVVVAPAGSTIFPLHGDPIIIKKVKIRGIESNGMICAEDEIGIGNNHEGIIVLPEITPAGLPANACFNLQTDHVFEIGLTPNRIDAMSHVGVAKDICAYLSHNIRKKVEVLSPFNKKFKTDSYDSTIKVTVENPMACARYAGIAIADIRIAPAPKWMQLKLKSIGLKPVNNIVDITNFLLHETGQPLHAFDLQAIEGNQIIVKNLPEGTSFITLDGRERKLHAEDIMICNGSGEPMCFGGVFGGLQSGVKSTTTQIFLESAWFKPGLIRRTSIRHNLRTEAATRFEKGVNISQTVQVLERAAMLIRELAGGQIISGITDVYPEPEKRTLIDLKNHYLAKISGKEYKREEVKSILQSLDFNIEKEDEEVLTVAVPFSKPDISLPADIIEEIMRIDGFDNIAIPPAINITPALEIDSKNAFYKETVAGYLTGSGFSEIFTNSITNSKYYDEAVLGKSVKIVNSLSIDLDIMRPSLVETGLESISYNINRKNNDLLFFEFGNTYSVLNGGYVETAHLCLYTCGNVSSLGWRNKAAKADVYFLKGICYNIFNLCGLKDIELSTAADDYFKVKLTALVNNVPVGEFGLLDDTILQKFGIKQPVLFADLHWRDILVAAAGRNVVYSEIPRFPAVQRDLSIVVNKYVDYSKIEKGIQTLKIQKLKKVKLFDIFESEKLGADKKAFAVNLTFVDKEKTLTDKETDSWVNEIIASLTSDLGAEIRK